MKPDILTCYRHQDSSVYLRILLEQPGAMELPANAGIHTSAVTRTEARRLLYRLHEKAKLTREELESKLIALDQALSSAEIIPCDTAILAAAEGPLPAPLGALDAIHLASALR